MLNVAEALALLLDAVAPLPSLELGLQDAMGLTLAERIVSDRDFPSELFQALIQFVGARFADKIHSRMGFGSLHFNGRARIA